MVQLVHNIMAMHMVRSEPHLILTTTSLYIYSVVAAVSSIACIVRDVNH